jgi:hypothetical protein
LGKPLNPNSVKFLKRKEALTRKADRINSKGNFNAKIINGELFIKPPSIGIDTFDKEKQYFN